MTSRRLVASLLAATVLAIISLAIVVGRPLSPSRSSNASYPTAVPVPGKETVTRETEVTVRILPPQEQGRLDQVIISPSNATVQQGGIFLFVGGAYDSNGRPVQNATMTWNMRQPGIGDIDSEGKFAADGASGTFEDSVILTAEQPWHGVTITKTASATVTVLSRQSQAQVQRVKMYPENVQVAPGQILRLYAVGYDASNQPVTGLRFNWEMRNASAGRVNGTGYFTAGSNPGTYENAVYVEAVQGSSSGAIKSSSLATVVIREPQPLSSQRLVAVDMVPDFLALMPGQQARLYALGYDGVGEPVRDTRVTWQVVDAKAGTVSDQNLFTAGSRAGVYENCIQLTGTQRIGDTEIVQHGYATVQVLPPEDSNLATLRVSPMTVVAPPGTKTMLAAEGIDGHGFIVRNLHLAWEMSEPQAGVVTSDGTFTASSDVGVWPRAIRLTATQQTASGNVTLTAYADVVVVGRLQSLQVSPEEVVVPQGQSIQLGIVGYDENGVQIPGLDFRWQMLDPAAGTIAPLGLFHATGPPGEYVDAIIVRVTQTVQ